MKRTDKRKPTAKELAALGRSPDQVRCPNDGCSYRGSKYQVKTHKGVCSHG